MRDQERGVYGYGYDGDVPRQRDQALMAVSVDYVARETASNLWRNQLMTVAAVLTVAVSLSLVGTAMLLRQGVANATIQWQHGVNVNVFMDPGISVGQRKSLQAQLHQLPYVRSCLYRSEAYDYSEAKRLLPPDEVQALTPGTMPSSLRCVLDDPNQAQAVYQQFKGRPGVASVSYPNQAVRNIQTVTRILQWVFLALAVILLLSASVLDLEHHPPGHLRPTARGLGHEARRRHQLVHPGAVHVRGAGARRRRRARLQAGSSSVCTSCSTSSPRAA